MRVIYDKTTGQIQTILKPGQNWHRMLKNWPNSASAEVNKTLEIKDLVKWRINPATEQLEQFRTDQEVHEESVIRINRNQRNALLTQSDWTQVLDNQLTEAKREEWRIYRQLLRDLDLLNPVWPDKPSK